MKPLIEGDSLFIAYTEAALTVIERSPEKYNTVIKYIAKIKQGEQSGIYCGVKLFIVGEPTYSAKTIWYASSIVHDSYHSKLYHDYLENSKNYNILSYDIYGNYVPPYDVYGGEKGEYACLEYQISFLREIDKNNTWVTLNAMKSRWWEEQYKEKHGNW